MPVTQEQADAAYTHLYNEVHVPVFFNKLAADYGIVPKTAAEAQEMLTSAGKLRTLYAIDQEQSASSPTSLLKRASAHIDAKLAAVTGAPSTPAAIEYQIKAAAEQVALRPDLAAAILAQLSALAA